MFGLWNLPTGADELAGVLDLARRPEEPSRSPSPPRRIVAGLRLLLSRRGVARKKPGRSRSSRTRGQEIPRIAIGRRRLQLSRLVVFSASPVLLVLDREFKMCHSVAQQLLRPRSPRLLGASEIAELRVQDGSQSADLFLFLFLFFTLKISTYLYDWQTPGYTVAHPAYPVGPSLTVSNLFYINRSKFMNLYYAQAK